MSLTFQENYRPTVHDQETAVKSFMADGIKCIKTGNVVFPGAELLASAGR